VGQHRSKDSRNRGWKDHRAFVFEEGEREKGRRLAVEDSGKIGSAEGKKGGSSRGKRVGNGFVAGREKKKIHE